MKLRTLLAGTAIASVALIGGIAAPTGMSLTAPAEAAVSISFSVFYDELAQHGDWVRYHDAYVFIPANVGAHWRPYTLGHWVYADRYGWTWASDEPFGWATYHYGRWGYAEDIGWYWVPGKRWAPAWVSWRRSADYVVWAPLPPSRHDGDVDVSISVSVGDIPEFYWVAVPTRRFLEPNLQVVVIHDDREIRQVVEHTEFIGTPRITNNIVVNNVINVNVIEQETGQQVQPVQVRETSDPREASATADAVTVFQGEIAADQKAKPPKVVDANEVKKVKRGGAATEATDGTQAVPVPDSTTGSTTQAPAEGTAPATGSAAPAENQPATGVTEDTQPSAKDKKKKKATGSAEPDAGTADQPATATEAPAQTDQPAAAEAPAKKDKKDKPAAATEAPAQTDQPATAEDQTGTDQGQPQKKKKGKKAEQDSAQPDDTTGTTTAPADGSGAPQTGKKKGKDKTQDQACDPATNPDCVPAQ